MRGGILRRMSRKKISSKKERIIKVKGLSGKIIKIIVY